MPTRIDQLIKAYEKVVSEPWTDTLSGQERVWFLVYDPTEQRRVDLRLDDFENIAIKSGKKWKGISLKQCFPKWMAKHEYREDYFSSPELIVDQLEADFIPYAINYLKEKLKKIEQDENTLVGVGDVSSLFGFSHLSEIIKACDKEIKGRLLIFFPGEYKQNQYRLLDARDGWDYLARPITL